MTQRYDTYKDSGVQWLGEIPGHWKTIRVKSLLSERVDKSTTGLEEPLSMSQKVGIIPTKEMDVVPNMASSYIGAKKVFKSDLVFNKLKAHLGVFAISQYDGLVSPDYAVYTPNELVCLPFMEYTFHTQLYICEFKRRSTGVAIGLTRLYTPGLFAIPFVYPPLSEQRSIVSFLDAKCGKIDEWVTKKQKEVEHLQELKQRVIADAVTRGLNPHVKMKATNIPWIKEIPEHWEMKRSKYLLRLLTESTKRTRKIGLENIESNTGKYILTESIFDGNGVDFDCGDILYGKLRPYLNKVWLAEFDGNAVGDFYVYRAINGYFNSFAKYLLMSSCFVGISNASTYGTKMPRVSSQFIHSLHFPVPPLSEQKQIVSYLDTKCSKIDKLIANITKEIECIKEYKQRLISDVVTGQIKVNQ